MSNDGRRRLHVVLAWFFAVQIPLAVALYFYDRELFNVIGILYLVIVSQWALVASHMAAVESDTPIEEDDDDA